jgi:hypothetical protein
LNPLSENDNFPLGFSPSSPPAPASAPPPPAPVCGGSGRGLDPVELEEEEKEEVSVGSEAELGRLLLADAIEEREEDEEGADWIEKLRLWPREDDVGFVLLLDDDPPPPPPPPRSDISPSATSSSSSSLRRFSLILCVTPSIFSGESNFFSTAVVDVAPPLAAAPPSLPVPLLFEGDAVEATS